VAKPFTKYTFNDAIALFNQVPDLPGLAGEVLASSADTPRRPPSAVAATKFFKGDHWQGNKGFIGQLPSVGYPGARQIEADIKARFESENVVKEVVETHIGGLLGREPLWAFIPEQKPQATTDKNKKAKKPEADQVTGKILTPWWNQREALKDIQKSAETVLLEGIAVKRIFFPKGLLPDTGILTASDLPQALNYIFLQTLTSDVAGVFTDPDTQKQIGVYVFDEKDDEGNVTDRCAELSFLNDEKETVCRVVKDKGNPQDYGPYQLGGRLLLFEMQRPPLITEQVQSNQKALNLAHTMMTRNVNMAGSRERAVSNAQPPRRPIQVQDPDNRQNTVQTEPGQYEVGAGAVMFLMGYPIWNEKGDVIGYTNPNVTITDPAQVEVFVQTRSMKYEAILSQCHQRHVLITGDAVTSAVSRKQAEKEWQRSLKETKTAVDAAGRWELEVSLLLAAQISNQTGKYENLRADFTCMLDAGEPTPDDIRIVMEMRQPGGPNNKPLISDETARSKVGIDDPAAELAKIDEEAPTDEEVRKRMELTRPPQELDKPNGGAIA
jgi:hypothetical protein